MTISKIFTSFNHCIYLLLNCITISIYIMVTNVVSWLFFCVISFLYMLHFDRFTWLMENSLCFVVLWICWWAVRKFLIFQSRMSSLTTGQTFSMQNVPLFCNIGCKLMHVSILIYVIVSPGKNIAFILQLVQNYETNWDIFQFVALSSRW